MRRGLYDAVLAVEENGTTAPFLLAVRSSLYGVGGELPLEVSFAVAGAFATCTLQAFLAGAWHDVATATTAAPYVVLGPDEAPRARRYRFELTGVTGPTSVTLASSARIVPFPGGPNGL